MGLVETIASQIAATKTEESVTIALNAPWGTGKSSFLNLLCNRLLEDESKPIVIRFNPWLYGSVEQLVLALFDDIRRAIQRDSKTDAALRELLNALAVFGSLLATLSTSIPVAAPAVIKELASFLSGQKSLAKQKETIDRYLGTLKRRLVVVIDDVDRLERDLIRLLFRMVRLNANFKYITYVLAFDRVVVGHSLSDGDTSGGEYLEKIIQVSYDIPQPSSSAIAQILSHELADLRRAIGTTALDTSRYKATMQYLVGHFTTIRGIKRYVNALRLTLPPVANAVDLVDFYAIELFRLLYSDFYTAIFQKRDVLVDGRMTAGEHDPVKRRAKLAKVEAEVINGSGIPEALQGPTRHLLEMLFPIVDSSGKSPGMIEQQLRKWSRDRRVCSHAMFERYFLLSLPEALLEERERTKVRESLAEPEELERQVRRAQKTGKIHNLLQELVTLIGGPDLEGAERKARTVAEFICSCDLRDDLQLADGDYESVSSVLIECLHRQQKAPREQCEFVKGLIEREGSLAFTVAMVYEAIVKNELQDVDEDDFVELQTALATKIREAAGSEEGAKGRVSLWDSERWAQLLRVVDGLERADQDVQTHLAQVATEEEMERIKEAKTALGT